ncbi:uncharacterized protein LOC113862132 [Abrus precatorius]|uniref:Uncharacterized protein LOC113862132 n=1 Tax=Abrus precatorius TaxID=3816 RepID=A0A8B8L4D5_ABRPR|nr:uncharacterized protein LOC113862132 [Abrus precatorius]
MYICNPNRVQEHGAITRFSCEAEMKIRLDVDKGCWVVCRFFDDHNHNLVDENYFGMLMSHRKMDDGDVEQMRRMRKSGIPTCKIYDSFVSQRGSYDMVGFCKKDIYNQIERDRRGQDGDVKEAEKFLISLRFKDLKLLGSQG